MSLGGKIAVKRQMQAKLRFPWLVPAPLLQWNFVSALSSVSSSFSCMPARNLA